MEKFYKTYSIKFEIGTLDFKRDEPIEITQTIYVTYPLTAEFAIGRSISSATNSAQVRIYNLEEDKRRWLYKDEVDIHTFIRMTIYAGYNGELSEIYRGSVNSCYSIRNGGDPDFVTVIDSCDAVLDMYLGKVSRSYDGMAEPQNILNDIGSTLYDLKISFISPNIEFSPKSRSSNVSGKTVEKLRELSVDTYGNQTMSIDNGEIYFLVPDNDIIEKFGVLQIDRDHGLLGSPRRRNSYITAEVLFEPKARLNQIALLESSTVPWLNQAYKIMGVSHNGVISGSKDGALTTTLDLFVGLGEWDYV